MFSLQCLQRRLQCEKSGLGNWKEATVTKHCDELLHWDCFFQSSARWFQFLLGFVSLLQPAADEQDDGFASQRWLALSSVWQWACHSPTHCSRLSHRCPLFLENGTGVTVLLLLLKFDDPDMSQAWVRLKGLRNGLWLWGKRASHHLRAVVAFCMLSGF